MQKKIIARQVDPGYQDSRLWEDDIFSEIEVYSNPRKTSHVSAKMQKIIDENNSAEIYTIINDMQNHVDTGYKDYRELINEMFPCDYKSAYTDSEIADWITYILQLGDSDRRQNDTMARLMSLYTGKTYCCRDIHGSSQSEWNTIYYAKEDYSDSAIQAFETIYYNTGSEYDVCIVEDLESVDIDNLTSDYDTVSIYCVSSTTDEIKSEIAAAMLSNDEIDTVPVIIYEHHSKTVSYWTSIT